MTNNNDDLLSKFSLKEREYNILIARMEPENNIETILSGFIATKLEKKFVVVGNMESRYGKYIRKKFIDNRIMYLGYISDSNTLNVLRRFSNLYFHGHTVGGTNPSLLEAMGSYAFICAHDNQFNKAILTREALYFRTTEDIINILQKENYSERSNYISKNIEKINNQYSWQKIVSDYESLMVRAVDS